MPTFDMPVVCRGLSAIMRSAATRRPLRSRSRKCSDARALHPPWQVGSSSTDRLAAAARRRCGSASGLRRCEYLLLVQEGQTGPRQCMTGFVQQRPLERRAKPPMLLGFERMNVAEEARDELAGRQRVRVAVFQRAGQRTRQHAARVADGRHDPGREIVLQREGVAAKRPVVVLGPDVGARRGIDQADVEANGVARGSHGALEEVARIEPLGRPGIGRLPFGDLGLTPRHDAQVVESCQAGGDVVGQPVGKGFRFAAATGRERENGDPQIAGECSPDRRRGRDACARRTRFPCASKRLQPDMDVVRRSARDHPGPSPGTAPPAATRRPGRRPAPR